MQSSGADDLLQFRDYNSPPNMSSPPAQINVNSPTHSMGSATSASRGGNDALNDLIYDMSNSAGIMGGSGGSVSGGNMNAGAAGGAGGGADGGADAGASNKVSFLTLEYYQQFFNVDTFVVLERIANSMIPKRASGNYLRSNIGQNPDLYGPFWTTVTLIFSIAISGNIASYLQHANDNYHWRYNFHLVSYAATCIFIYANLFPIALWAVFKYSLKPVTDDVETESASYSPSLLSLMCVYGYSLFIYIPVSVLWVIQISLLQWLLVITAALLSGSVLIIVLTPALRNSKLSLFLIIGILGAHFLLAAGFMLYFFHVPSNSVAYAPAPAALEAVTNAAARAVKQVVHPTQVVGNIEPVNDTR
ncbi:PREDICTED: protein YIPF1 [Rhagoletis zephyria]|uniref:protein YIPF1 n=1 Tax=Rhagoletis zephyria TaxID=28612 RepID=UPI0008116CD6|nr:PREDICTED: protein YIPF1 [Rhagoletis zephyria]